MDGVEELHRQTLLLLGLQGGSPAAAEEGGQLGRGMCETREHHRRQPRIGLPRVAGSENDVRYITCPIFGYLDRQRCASELLMRVPPPSSVPFALTCDRQS